MATVFQFFLFLAFLTNSVHSAERQSDSFCRCTVFDKCWPDYHIWRQFNDSIGGKLFRVIPPASPCHDPQYNEQACKVARDNWDNPIWRSTQAGAMQLTNWEMKGNQRCLISTNRTSRCFQGSVPIYGVNVSSASHVQYAVKFASRYNLRLVVKNTGHDYLGRSTSPGSLQIWMHNLKRIDFMDNFTPDGCKNVDPEPAVTVGGGTQWEELFQAAYRQRKLIIGAGGSSVGAAGAFPQAAGHSVMSGLYGLGADNILQYRVVTADGTLVTANQCQNKDLFWALRGGGGGTFGVVVSATHKTHPALDNLVSARYIFTANTSAGFQKFMEKFTEFGPSFSDIGWSGYGFLSSQNLVLWFTLPNKNTSEAEQTLSPLLTYAEEQGVQVNGTVLTFGSFEEYRLFSCGGVTSCNGLESSTTDGLPLRLASRLITREVFHKSPAQLSKTLISIIEDRKNASSPISITLNFVGGDVSRERDNAVHPAWRRTIWHTFLQTSWSETASVAEQDAVTTALTNANKRLIDMTPGSGAYMNEADYNEPNWQESFFGEHYSKLYEIKHNVDPSGLFVCRHCVGSENWSQDLNCRIK